MEEQKRSVLDWGAWLVATFFGSGKLPIAPGTWGSLAAALLYGLVLYKIPLLWFVVLTILTTLLGVACAGQMERVLGRKDPGMVVIDEVAGQWIAVLWLHHTTQWQWHWILVSFLTFRVFDILKPQPALWLQDNLPGGWGVMMDDVAAGVYAAILTGLCVWLAV